MGELLFGSQGNDVLVAKEGDWVLSMGGNDTLYGSGNTVLIGGAGNDVYYVGDETDHVSEQTDGGVDTVFISCDVFTTGINNFGNLERLVASGNNRLIQGHTNAEEIFGSSKDNTLLGGGGDDTLTGGAGNDVLAGEYGKDTLIGGTGNDTFILAKNSGRDTIKDFNGKVDFLHLEGEIGNRSTFGLGDKFSFGTANSLQEASISSDLLVYVPSTGQLFGNWDGTLNGRADWQFSTLATFENRPVISESNFIL